MSNIYEKIRENNKKYYGTGLTDWSTPYIERMYSDRTHFIFELLQNAEDACHREDYKNKKYFASFELYNNKLVFNHNGIPFDENDIISICNIGKGNKKNLIGRFGVGFKSVYNFTENPKIYSGNVSFEILEYVLPNKISSLGQSSEQTSIIMEFNKEGINPSEAYDQIRKKLLNFDIQNLIFLKYLETIEWKIYDEKSNLVDFGKYKKTENLNKFSKINFLCLTDSRNSDEKTKHYWLLLNNGKKNNNKIELAFKFDNKKKCIQPIKNAKLSVFFLTEHETHLKFLINGWFDPTPSRENIYDNEWNKKLIEKAAKFLSCSFKIFKQNNLLDVNLYNVLPTKFEKYYYRGIVIDYGKFNSFFYAIKNKLMEQPFLLCSDKKYHFCDEVLLAGRKKLVELLDPNNCSLIFDKMYWITTEVTESGAYSQLFKYFRDILSIPVKTSEDFAKKLNKDFLEKQSDEWFMSFYAFLSGFSKQKLLNEFIDKPIIRTINNKHVKLFNKKGKVHVYFPLSNNEDITDIFNIIKPLFIKNEEVKNFFINIDVQKINKDHFLIQKIKTILKKYQENTEIDWEENQSDLKKIIKYYKKIKEIKLKNEVLGLFMENIFFFSVNGNFQNKSLDYTVDEIYYPSENIYIYFEGNEAIRILEKKYLKDKEYKKFIKQIDFRKFINVKYNSDFQHYKNVNKKERIVIYNYHGWHERALNGFDPDFEIEGLDHALKNINYEKSRIIWHVVKKLIFTIYGTIEKATRQDYSNSREEKKFSKAGKMLMEYKWLPNDQEDFSYSKDLSLSELPDDFEKSSIDAIKLAEILSMKNFELNNNLKQLEENAPGIRKIFNIFKNSSEEQKANYIKILEQQKGKYDHEKEMENLLSSKNSKNPKRVGKKTKERVNSSSNMKRKKKPRSVRPSQKDQKDQAKIILFEEYYDDNHDTARCQLCHKPLSECSFNTKEGKYYHGTEQIVDSENFVKETDYTYLLLCPYCAAKYNYARNSKLLNSKRIIEKILRLDSKKINYIEVDLLKNNHPEKIYFGQKHLIGLEEVFNGE